MTLLTAALLFCGCATTSTVAAPDEILPLLAAHNKERAARGLSDLEEDPVLTGKAQRWAEHMAAAGRLVHSRLEISGTGYRSMGENIAFGYDDVPAVVRGWMESPGHRANILRPAYTRVGFGAARVAGGRLYWCAQFGG